MIPTDLEIEECSVSRSREPKKKPTRLRSIKLSRLPSLKASMKQAKSLHNPGEPDGSSNYIEASSCNSESGFDLNDKNRKCLVRKSSMKPVRILTKTVSLRHKKRPSVRRASVGSSGSPVDKPTCSSTLRGSKFPDDVEIQQAANGVAVKKVCPYTYCSIHGHKKHEPSPPLKRFLSTRRRQLIKSQRGTKPENQNQSHQTQRAKQSGNKMKGGQNSQTVKNGGLDVEKSKEVISRAGDDENVAEVVLGETSYPLIDSMENLQIDLKEEDNSHHTVSNLDNAHNDYSEEDDLTGVAGEPSVTSVNNSLLELPVAIEDRERVYDTQSRRDEETNTRLKKQNSQMVNNGDLDVEETGYAGGKAESKEVISSAGDDESVAEVETSYPLVDSMENLQIDLKEEDIIVSNLDNAHNDDLEADDLIGVAGEPTVASAPASVYNSLQELPVPVEDGERVYDTESSRDEETNTQLEKQNSQTVNNGDLDVEETGYAGAEAESKEVISSAGDDENVAEVVLGETSYPLVDSMENLQIDLKEEDNVVSNLDNAHNDVLEGDDPTGVGCVAGEPLVASSVNNTLRELPVAIEDRERVYDTQSSRDEETNTQLEKQNSQTVNNGDLDVEETGYVGAEAESKEVISSAEDDENVAEVVLVETSYPLVDSMENLQIDLKERDIAVSDLDNAHNDDSEADDLTGVAGEPSVASAPASVNNSLQDMAVAIEDRERVSDTQSSSDEETNTQLEKQNYSGLWNLIYRRMASDIAATDGALDKVNKGGNVEADDTLLRVESNESDQGNSKAGGDECEEDHESGNQEIELNQTDAIKLVQEAINRILFPETPRLSSDEVSVTSETISDQELNEQHHGEDNEMGIARSRALGEDKFGESDCKMLPDQKVLLKSKLMASKRWSNLKKVILLKRFVKALERMRNFNPRKPQYLPVEPDPEAEKVSLRRQTTEERKNTDEWMLDYALRQVISKLAPAQRKRVALLVNAFETVIPPTQTAETPRFRINLRTPSSVNPAEVCTEKENNGGNQADTLQSHVTFPEIKERTSGGCIEAERETTDTDQIVRVSLDDGGNNFIREITKPTSISSSNGEQFDVQSASSTPEKNKVSTAISSVISSHSVIQTLQPTASYKMDAEAKPANKVFPELSPPQESDPDCSTEVAQETPLGNQNYTRLWYLVYKHIASDVNVSTDGTQPADEAHKKDQSDGVKSDTCGSGQDASKTDEDMRENHKADEQKKKLQDEAVKLVQEAIDQILLPEVEDRFSDDQSISSDTTPDQEVLEKNSEGKELFISTSTYQMEAEEYSAAPDPAQASLISKNLNNQEGQTTLKEESSKSNMRAPKNWSNLKKLILLRRFVKAMEKVRKLNLREPRYLPLEPNAEAEKVNLKHQDAEERKKAEEWMLDFAIQQVVTKLSPARKKKVQLLVEAFETVTPMETETETYLRRNTAASSHVRPFKSLLGH